MISFFKIQKFYCRKNTNHWKKKIQKKMTKYSKNQQKMKIEKNQIQKNIFAKFVNENFKKYTKTNEK